MDRYSPLKELPKEITNLPQEDTVCSYCGISYLIHHEIKRLELKLQESLDRSAMLEKEKLNWSVEKQDLAHCLKEKQKKLAVLDGDVVSTKAKLRSMQKENDDLTDKLSVCLEELKSGRSQVLKSKQFLFDRIGGLQNTCQELNTALKVHVVDIKTSLSQLFSHWSLSQQQVHQVVNTLNKEIGGLHTRLADEASKHRDLSKQWDSTKAMLSDQICHLKHSLKEVKKEASESNLKRTLVMNEKQSLERQAHELSETLRLTKIDGQRQLKAVREESNRLVQVADERILDLKDTIASLCKSLGEKEQHVTEIKNLLGSTEKELRDCIDHGDRKYKQLEESLKKAKEDYELQVNELKLFYDHRIALLDEKFTKRELELKDACAARDIENVNTITKLKSALTASDLKCQRMVDSLKEDLDKEKSLYDQEMLNHLQQVKELEMKIANVQSEKEEAVRGEVLRLELAKQSLCDVKSKCSELEKELTSAYEEISHLQAVIQKQCEERRQLEA